MPPALSPPLHSSPKPSHKHRLPQDPLFTRLLILAARFAHTNKKAIVDLNTNQSATLAQLLSDTVHLRDHICSQLSASTLETLSSRDLSKSAATDEGEGEVYIHLLAPGGYDFAVGVLAILALGAAVSPLSVAQPVRELEYYVRQTRAVGVVTGKGMEETGERLADLIRPSSSNPPTSLSTTSNFMAQPTFNSNDDNAFVHVPVSAGLLSTRTFIAPDEIVIDSRRYQNPNGPGLVIFTSGTTGPPKAAVLPRASITDGALGFAEQMGLTPDHTLLHLLPVHHATGIWINFFPFLQAGATIEFKSGSFDPEWTWHWWRHSMTARGNSNRLTHFSGVPTIYMRMKRYFEEVIMKLDSVDEVRAYESAARAFVVMMCGTSALPKPIDDFWTRVRNGRRIVQRYGSTELFVVFNMPTQNNEDVPDGSVGGITVGVDVKLSTNPEIEGELLCRSYHMFSKYLHDPEATRAAFDEEGYFRSGDIVRQEGKHYFVVGRASVDIIKSGGYKISALDVEREILALPYIAECMVVGVPDDEFGQRVGCVVGIRNDEDAGNCRRASDRPPYHQKLCLDNLRADLRDRLAGYKLPTLLKVITTDIPKSATGKVVKKTLGPMYFPVGYKTDPNVQIWTRREKTVRPRL